MNLLHILLNIHCLPTLLNIHCLPTAVNNDPAKLRSSNMTNEFSPPLGRWTRNLAKLLSCLGALTCCNPCVPDGKYTCYPRAFLAIFSIRKINSPVFSLESWTHFPVTPEKGNPNKNTFKNTGGRVVGHHCIVRTLFTLFGPIKI